MFNQHNVVFDLSNIAFATRHAKLGEAKSMRQKQKDADIFLFKETLEYVISLAHRLDATNVVITAESKVGNWRKQMYPEYKGTRDRSDFYLEDVVKAIDMVYDFLKDNTAATCLRIANAEADDIIAVWCQETNIDTTICSGDTDFVQLLKNPKVKLYSPQQKKYRESESPEFDLFLKCIRGDTSDNIRSAYPRVRETKLREAFSDPLKMLNMLETVICESKVNDVYEFNRTLIDLTQQPQSIRDGIMQSISEYTASKYSELGIMKKLNDIGLVRFTDMFSGKDKPFKRQASILA
jgi:hypothetical protein